MTNLNVRFFVILKKPPILFIPNNIQAKAGQKLPLKTGQKMNFPPVDKRLYYISRVEAWSTAKSSARSKRIRFLHFFQKGG